MSDAFQRYERGAIQVETTGSITEAAGGIAVVVLSIIGLARADNGFLMAIAAIVLGVAILAQGGTVAAEFSKLLSSIGAATPGPATTGTATMGAGGVEFGGMTMEFLAGGAAIVLGVLALIGIHTDILVAAAVITAGGALILSAGSLQRMSDVQMQAAGLPELTRKLSQAAFSSTSGAQALAGIAAVVLGILALSAVSAGALTLVGLLVLGAAVAVSGAALTGRIARALNR
jgi:hypothetical protein